MTSSSKVLVVDGVSTNMARPAFWIILSLQQIPMAGQMILADMSLTTVSLMRLVSEENAVNGHTLPPQALEAARTSASRVLPVNNHAPFPSLTPSSPSSTSLLDLYLLQSSSCVNAGNNTTLPSSTVMDGQSPSKGVRRSSGSTTLSSLVEAYAASERSDVSPAFIHAGDLDRQSYVDARGELAAGPPSLPAPGPAPSLLLPPPPVYRS
ncbi:hypothetical protein KCU73_g15909, partial [Aureobasidium melanogenum]